MPRFRVLAAYAISVGVLLVMAALSPALPASPWFTRAEAYPKQSASDAEGSDEEWLLKHQDYVAQATVLVAPTSCAGFVAGKPDQVVTAAHCIAVGAKRVKIRTDGKRYSADVDRLDRDSDLALLRLDHPLAVLPLVLSAELPKPGEHVLFVGRPDRSENARIATVQKLDRCPSLPKVPKALFTDLVAKPGDSGAPLVDGRLHVVGLVHGGARCHIAAPVAPLARQLEEERPKQDLPVEANCNANRDDGPPRRCTHSG